MNYKEIAIYAVLAIVIVALVVYALSSRLFSSSYNVSVSILQAGGTPSYPYRASHFLINVTNKGSGNIDGMLLGFYLNSIPVNTSTVSIPAGQSVTIERNYTYQYPGNYSFQAVADPSDLLNMVNRQDAQQTLTIRINAPQVANPYVSIPNGNITDTQSFTTTGSGLFGAAGAAQRYNLSLFNRVFGPSENLTLKVFENLAGYISYANGAYAKYSNKSVAYSVWLQGPITPTLVTYVVSSFNNVKTKQKGGITYTTLSNTTSMCTWYDSGWTKIVTYQNSSTSETCIGFAGSNFSPTESQLFIGLLKNNTNMTRYQARFLYANITPLGSLVQYSNNSITTTNLFTDPYGFFFASSIERNGMPLNVSKVNDTCYGLIYGTANVNVCSQLLPTRNYSVDLPYGLLNSSEITTNYTVSLYSLVNESNLMAAHYDAANLISTLGINESHAIWLNGFRSRCDINSTSSLACGFLNYNYTSTTAQISLTNRFGSPITIKSIGCELAAGFPITNTSQQIGANSTVNFFFKCYAPATPLTAAINEYSLQMNYTVNNTKETAYGVLNITNQGLSSYSG
jgi:hypothetical protein